MKLLFLSDGASPTKYSRQIKIPTLPAIRLPQVPLRRNCLMDFMDVIRNIEINQPMDIKGACDGMA
jgi:hypothetical protein